MLLALTYHGPLDSIVTWFNEFFGKYPMTQVLMVVMGIDIVMGYGAAFIAKDVSSSACTKGVVKKVMIMMLVCMCIALEPYSGDIPISKLASIGFILGECTSILENANRVGIPIPNYITETLSAIKTANKSKPLIEPSLITTTTNGGSIVNVAHAKTVAIHEQHEPIQTPPQTQTVIKP